MISQIHHDARDAISNVIIYVYSVRLGSSVDYLKAHRALFASLYESSTS